ncbi:MAG: hypothetical protein QM704_26980 [Anaeromyxobacteraceae bacterium]
MTISTRNGFSVALVAVVLAACGGTERGEVKGTIDAAGGVIELPGAGVRVEVPAGAVTSGELEISLAEREPGKALRAVEVRTTGAALSTPFHVLFDRPAGVPATAALKVTKVDDHGKRADATDDHGKDGEVSGHGDDDGTFELEAGDDDGGHGEAEPGDDHGGGGAAEPGDDNGGGGAAEPGDDNGGGGAAEPGDDNGGGGTSGGGTDDNGGGGDGGGTDDGGGHH